MTSHVETAEDDADVDGASVDGASVDGNDVSARGVRGAADLEEDRSDVPSETRAGIVQAAAMHAAAAVHVEQAAGQSAGDQDGEVATRQKVAIGGRYCGLEGVQEISSKQVACPPEASSAAEGAAEAQASGGVSQSSGDLQGLVAAVNGVRSDIGRMANLLAGPLGNDRLRLPDRMDVADRAALRLLASDMKRQSALVQDLTSAVATASDGGPLPNHADMLKSLASLLSQTRSQLEDISPQFRLGQNIDLSIELVPNTREALGEGTILETERAVQPAEWLVEQNAGTTHAALEKIHAPLTSDIANRMQHGVAESVPCRSEKLRDCSQAEANDEMSRKIPPQALLQAALRDVLESSLLDVEAQINEWQELHANILVTDTSSATLDDWKSPPTKSARMPTMGELVSVFISFDPPSAPSDSPVSHSDEAPPSAVPAPRVSATRDQDNQDNQTVDARPLLAAAGERYTNFVDAHAQDRAVLAEKVRDHKRHARAGRDSLCAPTRQGASDDERMLEEYAQLSAELEELCTSKLPGIMSAVSIARSQMQPPASARLTAAPAVGGGDAVSLAGVPSSEPSRVRRQAPPAQAHARPVGGKFCSPLQRAAMAERLANKAATFCSPLDRAALAQQLAAKAGFPPAHSSSPPASDDHRALECATADGQDTQPVSACEQSIGESGKMMGSGGASAVHVARGGEEVPETHPPGESRSICAARCDMDEEMRAKVPMLQLELQSLQRELAAAAEDCSQLAVHAQPWPVSASRSDTGTAQAVAPGGDPKPQAPVHSCPPPSCLQGKPLPDVPPALPAACQLSATGAAASRRDAAVNTSVHEMVAVAAGGDEGRGFASDVVQDVVGSQAAVCDMALVDWQSVSSFGTDWQAPVAEEMIEMQENASCRLDGRMGAVYPGEQVVGLLREANRGVLDISRMVMQFSMHVSSSPISSECSAAGMGSGNGEASSGLPPAARRAEAAPLASTCAVQQPNSPKCAGDVRPISPRDTEAAERPSVSAESPQEVYGQVVASVESLAVNLRAVADLQASTSQGNQLLLEKTDLLLDGVKLGLGQLEQGQTSMTGAIFELNCQLSQVRTHLMGMRQSAASPDTVGAEVSVHSHLVDVDHVHLPRPAASHRSERAQAQTQSHAQIQTQTQAHSHTQTPMHAETQTQELMSHGGEDSAPSSWHKVVDARTPLHRHGATITAHGNESSGSLPLSQSPQAYSLASDVGMRTAARLDETESTAQNAPALIDLREVIRELQNLTAEIKSTQQRQVQQRNVNQEPTLPLGVHDVSSAPGKSRRAAGGGVVALAPRAVDLTEKQVAESIKSSGGGGGGREGSGGGAPAGLISLLVY